MPSSQTSPALPPPAETAVPEAVKNPDEIEIIFEDEDDEEHNCAAEEALTSQGQGSEKESVSQADTPASANPDEISIDFSDDDDDTQDISTASETQSTSTQNAPTPAPIAKPYPTKTHFLALDKCEPKRQFLEIIDLPHIQGPVEFKYDEEWLAIVRTLDQYLSLEHRQKQPLQGRALKEYVTKSSEKRRNKYDLHHGLTLINSPCLEP